MDKKLKYIRTFYTIIFTIIVLYIVRNNFILPNHIFKYKIFLSMEQKIENLVLGILVFFVSSISYFVVDEKFNIKNLKNYWALESLRKFIWINEVESVFKGADTYQNKKINKSISNFISLSLISLFTIFYIKPEWTLFLIYLFVIVIAVCVIYFKNKSLYFLEYISI